MALYMTLYGTRLGGAMTIPPVPSLPATPAPGRMSVDFEERVDFARLRGYRLSRVQQALEASGLGALLVFDNNNIRYLTGVAIGEWTRDKLCRYALYTRTGELFLWDFGSAAVHHRMYCPWLKPEHCIASYSTMRGATAPGAGLPARAVAEIKGVMADTGVAGMPVGVDFAEIAVLFELQRQGIDVRDGQQVMLDARQLKSRDEIALLTTAASMVDGVYQDITAALKPGVRENEIVALANKRLYEMGSDDVESINAVSGERCNPHPHNFSDRMIRPGEQAFFDIMHSYNGYRTCYYRTFSVGRSTPAQRDAYARASEWMNAALDAIKPGAGTDQVARLWPTAQEIGLPDEKTAFGLQFGHGLGLALHERPIISRLSSLDAPMEIQRGMVFAVETYCPASDGVSAARLEEEVVVVEGGVEVITRFPSAELFVTNPY
jgi:Xaa-Pro aminopeptidase